MSLPLCLLNQIVRISGKLTNQWPPPPLPINILGAFPPTISECTRLSTALGEEGRDFPCLEIQLRSNTDMNRRGQGARGLFFHKILLSRSMHIWITECRGPSEQTFLFCTAEQPHSEAEGHYTYKCTSAGLSSAHWPSGKSGSTWSIKPVHISQTSQFYKTKMSFHESYCPFAKSWLPAGLLWFSELEDAFFAATC